MTGEGPGATRGPGDGTDERAGGFDLGAVVETLVYAPLGLALEGRTLLPRLVERGRNHVAMARMVGEFAVRKGAEDLAAGAVGAQERLIGLVGQGRSSPGPSPASGRGPTPGPTPGQTSGPTSGPTPPPTAARVAPEAAAAAAGIDPVDLPIPDYDLLSASQVVPRLESLGDAELELVGRYEAGTRGRRTILAKVAQLRTDTGGHGSAG